jgi:hypothetical protein
MDKITQRLCASLFGTAAIIFAFAFLIRSASPAQADNGPETTYTSGKYMIQMDAIWAESRMNFYTIVWDTETGRSKLYFGNTDVGMKSANSGYQLPSSPL